MENPHRPLRSDAPIHGGHRVAVGLGVALSFFFAYGGVNLLQFRSATLHTLPLPIDDRVPLSPPWVVAYLWLFAQVWAPLVIVTERRVLRQGVLAFTFLVAAGMPFWILWPVTVPREPVPITDLWTYGLTLTRVIDPPANCFPSMHVAESCLAALLVRRHDRPVGDVLLLCTALIWYSTMALDQHWFVDGAAGVALALLADRWFFRPLPAALFRSKSRRWHLLWIGIYVALFTLAASGWWLGWLELSPEDGF